MRHQKYDSFGNVSAGRVFLNKELLPRFADKFKDEDKILFIGVHKYWDYACYFNNPGKLCDFKTLDYHPGSAVTGVLKDEQPAPDICTNIESCDDIPEKSFDGIIMIGVYEAIKNKAQAFGHINRLLKDEGLALISVPGRGYRYLSNDCEDEQSMAPQEVFEKIKPLIALEVYIVYEKETEPTSISIVCKKGVPCVS